ncbi:competence/damage-inducible protein A [Bacteroidota bacterium]
MFNISLLTIGDEICIGQVINTNAAWIASKCTLLGANVIIHSSIGDNKKEMYKELNRLIPVSDLIIITGGLGPTHDDITKPVLTEYFNDKLVLHKETLEHLEKLFQLRGYKFTERNRNQALLPSKAKLLFNNVGTAPGMLFEKGDKYIVSLPGVPAEMKSIMIDSVLPFIQKTMAERLDEVALYKTLHTTGTPESKLADMIGDPDIFMEGGTLAFLPSYRGVRLRIGIKAKSFDIAKEKLFHIESELNKRAGKFIFGSDEESLVSKVGSLLGEKNKTVSVAESCTGGLLGGEFTSVSGSSEYFSGGVIVYCNKAKEIVLGVGHETLKEFGAVSEQVAIELAANVRKKFDTDYGIGITGIAGPTGGSEDKPVGTVWIGLADSNIAFAKKYVFGNDRDMNRERAVGTALAMLLKNLSDNI